MVRIITSMNLQQTEIIYPLQSVKTLSKHSTANLTFSVNNDAISKQTVGTFALELEDGTKGYLPVYHPILNAFSIDGSEKDACNVYHNGIGSLKTKVNTAEIYINNDAGKVFITIIANGDVVGLIVGKISGSADFERLSAIHWPVRNVSCG